MYGPTRPLEVPEPQGCEVAESDLIVRATDEVSCGSPHAVLEFVESLALRVVQKFVTETEKQWACAYPFGSCGLSASVADSDLDIAVFCPFVVTRFIFFHEFPALLETIVGHVIVVAARVPVVRFVYQGMSVDVVFISVALSQPPTSDQLLDDSFLLQVARDTRPSVNGIRFTFEVRRRLPVPHKVFATVLKAVKFWAMRRQVYGNIYTYPNGAVFAIMVARVCQVLPSPHPSVLLRFFFLFYTQWMSRHDHISPVYLTATLESRGRIPGLPESWKPAKNECFRDLFPVISPAYPYVNDASNVGRCGLESLYSEITQAQRVISASDTLSLEKLWRPYCIMEDFAHFLLVEVSSLGDDMADAERILGRWGSYVGSKLRFLIYSVERFVHARPHPHKLRAKMDGTFVDRKVCCSSIYFLIGVRSKNSGSSLRRCMFDEATDEFIYALQDGCSTENQSRSFHRDERKMHWPQVKLIGTSEISSFVDGL